MVNIYIIPVILRPKPVLLLFSAKHISNYFIIYIHTLKPTLSDSKHQSKEKLPYKQTVTESNTTDPIQLFNK